MLMKRLWIIPAILLVMALFIGCGGGGGDTNIFDEIVFFTGEPSDVLLLSYGLTKTDFNTIKTAAGGGFEGWAVDIYGDLGMFWTDRNPAQFTTTSASFALILSEGELETYDNGMTYAGDNYMLLYYAKRVSDEGYYMPARTMVAFIEKE
jgi:hypothetical protein